MQDLQRPAIGDDMVQHQHQPVIVTLETHQAGAQQWAMNKIEGSGLERSMMGAGTRQAVSLRLAQGLAQGLAHIHQRQIDMQAWCDELHRHPVHGREGGAQRLMAVEQAGQAVFQRLAWSSGQSNVNTVLK